MQHGGVYQIKCLVNGAVYVGQTKDIMRRRGEHFSDLRTNSHHTLGLQDDYNKFGKDAFEFSVAKYTDDETEKDMLESQMIADARSKGLCYNTFSGGRTGFDVTDDFRHKVSVGNRGKYVDESTRAIQSQNAKIQWQDEKYSNRMRESAKSQWNDPVYREIMKRAHTGNSMACGHKLTPDKVLAAREAYANGESVQSLADKYGVKYCAMLSAIKRRSWKNI